MKTICHIATFFFLLAPCLEAQDNGVRVSSCRKGFLETEPRRIATAVFQVINETSEEQELISDVKLPPGWMLVTENPSFYLGPNESDTRLVSFLIPQTALTGQYELTYLVNGRKHRSLTDSSTIDVAVLPVRKLEVKLLAAPDFIIAGEDYRASFAVFNGSNTESNVSIKIDSGENLPFAVDAENLKLASGESRTLSVVVRTDVNRKQLLRHHLRLTAQAFEDQEIKAQSTSHVEILPRTTVVMERFHKIPTEMMFRYATKRNEEDVAGFQAQISGSGMLDEEGKKGVRFLFRGPDIQDKSIFGRYDECRFTFWTKNYELRFGDYAYSLSPLIENYRYGRGVEGRVSLGNLRVGAYHMETRWLQPEEEHAAGYVDYFVLDKCQVGLNYLKKEIEGADENIASVECRLGPMGNTNLMLEYASGKRNREEGRAYRLEVSSRWNWISYVSRFIHAAPGCPAYYGDRDFASAGLLFRLKENLKLIANLQQEKKNLDLDPTLQSAPLERSYNLGFNYRLKTGTSFYTYWRDRSREDQLPNPEFRYQEETITFGAAQSFKKSGLNASAESGKSQDGLCKKSSRLDRYKVYAYFKPTLKQSYSGYVYFDNNGDFSAEGRRRITAGINSSFRIADRTFFSLNFQTSDDEGSQNGDRDILEIGLGHKFRNQSEVRLHGRRTAYGNLAGKYGSALQVEVTIPFGLPTAVKKDYGRIKGYVYDEESNQPLADVILKVDGATAVTDKNGNFSFPAMEPCAHYLIVSTGRIGLDRIASRKTPREVIVEGGKETRVEIGITRAASLSGHVLVYRLVDGLAKGHNNDLLADVNGNNGNNHHVIGEDDHNDSWNHNNGHHVIGDGCDNDSSHNGTYHNGTLRPVKAHGLSNVLVELTDGSEVMRRLTDREGRFEFEEVRPGEWTLKIYQNNLPKYHHFDRDIFNFNLQPGQREDVLVRALPTLRSIQIIQEGGTILEEAKK